MEEQQLRVCHIIHSLGPGGAEHVLVELAEVASQASVELAVFSLMPITDSAKRDRLTELGVTVRSFDLPNRWDPRGLTRAADALRELHPDVIHSHLKHADLAGAYASHRLGVPLVSTLHRIEDEVTPLGRTKRWLGAQARLRKADLTVAVSDAVRRWYLASFAADAETVVTLHNGVSWPTVTSGTRADLRRQLGISHQTVIATMLGVMRPGKGYEQALAASTALPADLDVRLLFVGDGPLRPALEAAARAHRHGGGGPDRVVFAGWRTDVVEVLAASDLIVHPALFDALPTALIQSLAAGLPSVASDVDGIPEIVTSETGILVPPGDTGALAAGIAALTTDRQRRETMGRAARVRFENEFDARIWVQRLRRLYERVL